MGEPEMSLKSLHLDDLPTFDPPDHLWPRIVAERQRRQASRRRTFVGAALAAGIALAAVALPHLMSSRPPAFDNGVVELQRRSQALEHELAALTTDGAGPIESEAELRLIEVALQAAYDRGGELEEIAPLWRQRNELLSSLIAVHAAGGQLTRI